MMMRRGTAERVCTVTKCSLCVGGIIHEFFLLLKLNSVILCLHLCGGRWGLGTVNSELGYVIQSSCGSLVFTHSFIYQK